MRVVVTGGAGYVGSACLRYLTRHGHAALAYDNLSEGHEGAVEGAELVIGDLSDTDLLRRVLVDFRAEAVMHFAASTYVGESVEDPEKYYRNNVAGSLSLLTAIREANVQRMLFSSTCATYGQVESPMKEDDPQNPLNPYARTKLAVEWMIRDFATAYALGFTLLRYFNAAGGSADGRHGEHHEPETHLIPLVLQVPLGTRENVKIYGADYPTPDGTCIRDYVHIEDLASAHLLAIEATNAETRAVYNVGTGTGTSVLDVIQACERVTGTKIAYEVVERRAGDAAELVAEPMRLKQGLNWNPTYTAIEGTVETAWRWHRGHPTGY